MGKRQANKLKNRKERELTDLGSKHLIFCILI